MDRLYKNNTIYDRKHNVIGYMAEPMIMDSYGRTVGYMANGSIYASIGMQIGSFLFDAVSLLYFLKDDLRKSFKK